MNTAFQQGFNMMLQMHQLKRQKEQAELAEHRERLQSAINQKKLQLEEEKFALAKKKATQEEQAFKLNQQINQNKLIKSKIEQQEAEQKRKAIQDFFTGGGLIAPTVAAGTQPGGFQLNPDVVQMARQLQSQSPAQQAYGQHTPWAQTQAMATGQLPTPPGFKLAGMKPTSGDQPPSSLDQGKYASQLRKEFDASKIVKDYDEINFRYGVMQEAMKEAKTTKNFVAVDQAIITTFNKMTDPDSVVRESEYIRTSNDLSLWNRLKGKIAKFKAGGPGLTPDDRDALSRMANKFMNVAKMKYEIQKKRYTGFFKQAGLDPQKYFYQGSGSSDISNMTIEELQAEKARLEASGGL